MKNLNITQKDLLNIVSLQTKYKLGLSIFTTPVASVFDVSNIVGNVDTLQIELRKVGLKSSVNLKDLLICIYK